MTGCLFLFICLFVCLNSTTETLLISTGESICRMFLMCSSCDVFLWVDWGYSFWQEYYRHDQETHDVSMHYLSAMLTFISWLRWCVLDLSLLNCSAPLCIDKYHCIVLVCGSSSNFHQLLLAPQVALACNNYCCSPCLVMLFLLFHPD